METCLFCLKKISKNSSLGTSLKFARNFANFPGRSPEVQRYLDRQINDPYNKLAREHSYRARSAFKLMEMIEKNKIVKPGDVVIDFGAAPGSWCQVLSEFIFPENNPHPSGYILGVDLQQILPIDNVDLLCKADILKPATQAEIRRRLDGRKLNAVFSDLAPNPTGDSTMNHERIIRLCRGVLKLVTDKNPTQLLANNANFLCKIWDGQLKKEFSEELRLLFGQVRSLKPYASRDNSSELYLYASNFKAN